MSEQTNQTHGFATQNKKCLRTEECNRNLTDFLSTLLLSTFYSVFVQNLSYEKSLICTKVNLSYEWFHSKSPFDTEPRANSEMVCYTFNKRDARSIIYLGSSL